MLHICFQTVFPVPLVQFTLQFSAVHCTQTRAPATGRDLRSCSTSPPGAAVIAAYQAEEKSTLCKETRTYIEFAVRNNSNNDTKNTKQ